MRALSLSAVLLCGCSQYLDFSSTRTAVDAQIGDAGLDARSLDAPTDAVAEDVLNEVGFDAGVDARGNRDVGVDSDIASDVGIDSDSHVALDVAIDTSFDAVADTFFDAPVDISFDVVADAGVDAPPPIPSPGFLSLGTYHSCASFAEIPVCWGAQYQGDVSSLVVSDIVQMDHGCVVHRNGSISCWGSNYYGALGDGTTDTRQTPALVVDLVGLVALQVAVGSNFACARFQDGSVRCWGLNNYGQLGIGLADPQRTRPALVAISNVVQISAGRAHICVRLQNGEARCWGDGTQGQLGDGRRTASNLPVRVSLSNASIIDDVAAGADNSCMVARSGDVYCWGSNTYQQTGNPREGIGGALQFDTPRQAFGGVQRGAELALGSQHACLREGQNVRCWGGNYQGQLGQGYTSFGTWEPQRVDVDAWNGPGSLKVGGAHTCVRRPDSALSCWGSNQESQIGSNMTLQTTPWVVQR